VRVLARSEQPCQVDSSQHVVGARTRALGGRSSAGTSVVYTDTQVKPTCENGTSTIEGLMGQVIAGADALEDVPALLARWKLTPADAREQIYRAKTPRERERWHALWLLARGWPAAEAGPSTGARSAYDWRLAQRLCSGRATNPGLRAKWWLPPALAPDQQAALKDAVEGTPTSVGLPLANWTWRSVQHFLQQQCGLQLSRSSCLRWLHRLGFTWKRPKKRLRKRGRQETCSVRTGVCALAGRRPPIRGEALVRR
jgi:hypothetical protein